MTSAHAIFESHSTDDTRRLGLALADLLPDGANIALLGTLGAGKTELVRALAEGCGISPQDVTSPTFIMCQNYVGRRTLYHLDAYRIRDDDEFLDLGVDELFDSPALVIVEWADRVADCMPEGSLTIAVHVSGQTSRQFEFSGPEFDSLLSAVRALPHQPDSPPHP